MCDSPIPHTPVAAPEGIPVARRHLLGAAALAASLSPAAAQTPASPLLPAWEIFRARFLTPDGRVIDTGNQNVSHSEGQGFGMIFAASSGDRDSFERIWTWTRQTLKRPRDALHAWRYRPGDTPPVADMNNATDGDLYIAWGLILAAERWRMPAWRQQAASIGRDLLRLCIREVRGRSLLLPGVNGFDDAGRTVINPSYYVFPALQRLDAIAPDPRWRRLQADGLALLREARFGRWGLPPDWLELPKPAGQPRIAAGWPTRFSFDAVRTPLLLAWGGQAAAPAVTACLRFWRDDTHPRLPAWVDLDTGAISDYAASNGVVAIMRLLAAVTTGPRTAPALPVPGPDDDYYASALIMLSRAAAADLQLLA
ncbi:MAG TPA: glycosyl hydrolase family 8 [Roseomonas sp.]|jgi:endoglucanase